MTTTDNVTQLDAKRTKLPETIHLRYDLLHAVHATSSTDDTRPLLQAVYVWWDDIDKATCIPAKMACAATNSYALALANTFTTDIVELTRFIGRKPDCIVPASLFRTKRSQQLGTVGVYPLPNLEVETNGTHVKGYHMFVDSVRVSAEAPYGDAPSISHLMPRIPTPTPGDPGLARDAQGRLVPLIVPMGVNVEVLSAADIVIDRIKNPYGVKRGKRDQTANYWRFEYAPDPLKPFILTFNGDGYHVTWLQMPVRQPQDQPATKTKKGS